MSRSTCFNCLSSDGLATYEDGTYCFSCHKKTKDHKLVETENVTLKGQLSPPFRGETGEIVYNVLPNKACVWLVSYGITMSHVKEFNIFWSQSYNRLVFPYYIKSSADLRFAWMRDLDGRNPKWLRYGEKDLLYGIIKNEYFDFQKVIVLVEDVVSAIRVSDFLNVIALGSTNASDRLLVNYLEGYDYVLVWLDGDEAGKKGAESIRKRFKLTKNIIMIRTPKDPKEYDVEEMGNILNDRIKSTQSSKQEE